MGKKKKINKETLKKSQRDVMIWFIIIGIFVVGIILAMTVVPELRQKSLNNSNSTVTQDKASGTDNSSQQKQNNEQAQNDQVQNNNTQTENLATSKAEIQTSKGNIQVVLENSKMPITVNNFTKLVNSNFYNGLNFHRVENWVIQGGDPKGDGTGGSADKISLETHPDLKNIRGAIAMARSDDPNSATSQFYILKNDASSLDSKYAVFGNVVSGMDVVDKIEIGDKIISIKVIQ